MGKEPYFCDRPAKTMASRSYCKSKWSILSSIRENITLSYDRMNMEELLNVRIGKITFTKSY